MSEYKRLTGQEWSDDIDLTQELGYSYIYKRLHEIEDKIEQGKMIELPCKVGDCAYFVGKYEEGYDMLFGYVQAISIDKDGCWIACHYEGGLSYWHKDNDKNLFFSAKEAEKRLRELQGETKL